MGETAKALRKHLLSEVVAAPGTVHSATAAGPQDKFSSCQLTCWGHAVWSAFCHSCQAISEPNFMLNCSVSDHTTHVPGERGCCLPISISLSLSLLFSQLSGITIYVYINIYVMHNICAYSVNMCAFITNCPKVYWVSLKNSLKPFQKKVGVQILKYW